MTKPKNKNKREIAPERLLIAPEFVLRKAKRHTEGGIIRKDDYKPAKKTFLIVCEGPTEAAYFEALCYFFDINTHFTIKILPDRTDNSEGHQGSSVKGLLYMAMKEQKMALLPFDEVWIVTDNDEGNAYKLDDNSLKRIKEVAPKPIYDTLKTHQVTEMNVRKSAQNNEEHLRKRYFLCYSDYEAFLKEQVLAPHELTVISTIIKETTKGQDFSDLYSSNRNVFFFDEAGNFISNNNKGEKKFEQKYFDKEWRNYIKIAYSSIAFEYWLLLHFEKNSTPFYNSREIIKYFDDKAYFENSFEKGWYLYKNRDTDVIKTFFQKVYQALKNNIWLNTMMQSQIRSGKMFYELNPYSNILCLANLLLKHQNILIGYINMPISHHHLNNILVAKNEQIITISLDFGRKQSVLKQEIASLFSLKDEGDTLIPCQIVVHSEQIILMGSKVEIAITLNDNYNVPLFLHFIEKNKDNALIWMIQT